MAKGARRGEGGGRFRGGGGSGEHQVTIGAIRKLGAQGVGHSGMDTPVWLLARLAHVHGAKVEAVAITQGVRGGNGGLVGRARG